MRALVYDNAFRERARRKQAWGFFLLVASAGIWLWIAVQLLLPYPVTGRDDECQSRVFYTKQTDRGRPYEGYAEAEGTRCAAERDWAELLALLLLSLPTAVVGTVLYTSGSTGHQLSEHTAEVNRLKEFSG
ncbi:MULTISPECIES: hypothetical protein [Streptomyces]|uniref:hypothetical protein n=1 Tax=Streptomyces TaxID=1883 RepID=UPI000F6D02A2|nr:hypothetical protein [Streptomyces sp. W1SF4]AZM87110.1 hypothetical protein D1J60_00055 [Streptomyces sp. W1SF4]AZM93977.1 hypothetical protein D1J60_36180 [Streptomyces sp. W1SF4]